MTQTFTSMQPISITLNGKKRNAYPIKATYVDIVRMYVQDKLIKPPFDLATHPGYVMTITYDRGPAGNPEGSVAKGGSVDLVEGMIINVSDTSAA